MRFSRRAHILAAAVLTVMAAGFYVTVQQSLRMAANQPQKAMAQEVAHNLNNGIAVLNLANGQVDMAKSAAPFILIYDQYGNVIGGNGYLNGHLPRVPVGVLTSSKHHANVVTWQPADGVRIASVSVAAGNRYVLGGRSLHDTETAAARVGFIVFLVWLAGIVAIFLSAQRHPKPSNN